MHNQALVAMGRNIEPMVFFETEEPEEFDPAEEFAIILNSALNPGVAQDVHYVHRTRKLTSDYPDNFYTFAAQTVVACYKTFFSKQYKYYNIMLHLKKARVAVNKNLDEQVDILKKIEELANSKIDLFDY